MNSETSISDLDQAIIVVIKNLEERSEEPMNFWKKIGEDSSNKDIQTSRYFEAKPH
jgi:hypothetical protein